MAQDYVVDAETHERVNDALIIATSKLDAAERLNAKLLEALKAARPYLAKMVADNVNTVVPPSRPLAVVEAAIEAAENQQ